MAKFSMIDTTKPLRLLAHTRCAQVDPEFEELAITLRMPALRDVAAPTADAEPLWIEKTRDFLAWLMTSCWGRCLENDLQCMSQDADGRPLLTSWLKASEFEELVREAQGGPFGPCLQQSYDTWIALGMEEVFVDGYAIHDPSTKIDARSA